jgi:hypothetical protein
MSEQSVIIPNFVTSVVRLVNANVDKARPYETKGANGAVVKGAPKFGVRAIQKPMDSAELWEATQRAADLGWPPQILLENGQQVRRGGRDWLQSGMIHNPLRNGDQLYASDPKKFGLFQSMVFFNASSAESRQPLCFDISNNAIDPSRIYPGCYARLVLNIKPYGHDGKTGTGKGITYYLQGVQFIEDGPRLGGGAAGILEALSSNPHAAGVNFSAPYTALGAPPPAFQANPQTMLATAVAQAEQQWAQHPAPAAPVAPPAYATPIQAPPAPVYAAPMAAPPGMPAYPAPVAPPGMPAYPAPVAPPPAPLPGAQPGYPPGFFPGR